MFDNETTEINVDGVHVKLSLWDTAGQEEYDRLRPLSYEDVDVFLIVYSIDDPDSLYNVEEQWVPEIQHNCGKDIQ